MSRSYAIDKLVRSPSTENMLKELISHHIIINNNIVCGLAAWCIAGQIGKLCYWAIRSMSASQESYLVDYVLNIFTAISLAVVSQMNDTVRLNLFMLFTGVASLLFSICFVLTDLNGSTIEYESVNLSLVHFPMCLGNVFFASYALEVVAESEVVTDADNLTQVQILTICEDWRRQSKHYAKKLGWLSVGSSVNFMRLIIYLYDLFLVEGNDIYRYTMETVGFYAPNILGLVAVAWLNDYFVCAESVTHKYSVKVKSLGVILSSASLPALGISLLLSVLKYFIFA